VHIDSDWTSGYCATLLINNTGGTATTWNVSVPFKDTITSLWNGRYTTTGTMLGVTGVDWNAGIAPGEQRSVGYCANRVITAPPPPPPPPAPEPAKLTASVLINNDWGGGYCGLVTVSNTGGSTAVNWSLSVPVQGRVASLWNGTFTQSGGAITLSGPSWNHDLAAGKQVGDIGFCANR
jgi:cellulase/cellobiase CelA1